MNAQDYISSGLLEAYVLGSLNEAESEQVAGAICRFPQVAQEVAALEEALYQQASLAAVAPPPSLEDAIWATLQAQQRPELAASDEPARSGNTIPLPPPAVQADSATRPRRILPLGTAAALVLLIVSLSANFLILRESRQREYAVVAANQQLKSALQDEREKVESFRNESEMAASPDMQQVAMRSLKPGEAMAATMYWNPQEKSAYVRVHRLPPPPSGMQYQLWAIADGKPVSLGMIDNEIAVSGGLQPVDATVSAGQAFAVSLEKSGGVPSPTAERIMLMGKVPA